MEIEAVQELEIETEKVGPQGYSAYEVAVQNGFEGTEAEWLESLKGADGTDGAPGPQGQPGADGQDGADATINGVSTINIVAGENITLDQEDGTLTINSTGGGTRDYADLTNKPSINNVTLNGNKSLSDLGAGTYDKPANGIPKADLASDVQASLSKADTALQTHQDISGKQDVLTAGTNITIDENNVISATGGANYTAGEGIDIINNEISSTMPIYEMPNNTSSNPFVIDGKPAGIYIFRKNQSISPNAIYIKAYEDTVNVVLSIGSGFLILTDTLLDKSVNDWKTVGVFYGSMFESHLANSNYYITGMTAIKVWQPSGGFNNYDYMANNKAGFKFVNPEDTAKIISKHTYTVLPESSVVPTSDNQFTNKKYVDEAVAGVSGGSNLPIYVLNTTNQLNDNNGSQNLESDAKIIYNEIITDAYAKDYKNIAILLCSTSSGKNYMFYSNSIISTSTVPSFYADCTFKDKSDISVIVRRSLSGFGIWNDGVFTLSGSLTYDVEKKNLLYSNNSTAYTPTSDYNPATKKYVDDVVAGAGGQTIQYETMPTASADYLGKIVQYTGTTDSTYTNGYFYIGTTDGAGTPTYGWSNIEVQENSSNIPLYTASLEVGGANSEWPSEGTLGTNDKLILQNIINDAYQKGLKFINLLITKDSAKATPSTLSSGYPQHGGNIQIKPTSIWLYSLSTSQRFIYNFSSGLPFLNCIQMVINLTWNGDIATVSSASLYNTMGYFLTTDNGTAYTPSRDYNPATKKYVDDSIAAAITTTLGGSF